MILTRTQSLPDGTFGNLADNDGNQLCLTVELPWLDNHPQISCIPIGTYEVNTYFSPKHGFNVWRLANVPQRNEIEIHPANLASELLGCIGVGDTMGGIDGVTAVLNSQNTFKMLQSKLPDSFTLVIA